MILFTVDKIRELADMLDVGYKCFINKRSGEFTFLIGDGHDYLYLDDEDEIDDDDLAAQDWKEIESNPDDYYEIEKMSSREAFSIMEDFIDIVDSGSLRKELMHALTGKKPFQRFKYAIDDSGDYRQKWFDFKSGKMQEWVKAEIDYFNRNKRKDNP
jgi:hypothetical protein